MKKDRDWIDYTNLAANVATSAQLHSIDKALGERANREEMARLEDEREAKLREIVFKIENMIEGLQSEMTQKPLATFAVALEIKNRFFDQDEITTASFRAYEDKDRLKKVLNTLAEVAKNSAVSLTPAEKEDAEKCAKYRVEMPRLEMAISLQKEQDNLNGRAGELNEKIKELAQIKASIKSMPTLVKFWNCWFGIIFLLAIAAVVVWFNSTDSDVILSPLAEALFLIAGLAGTGLASLEKKRPELKNNIAAVAEMKKRKHALQAEIQTLKQPPDQNAQDLQQLLEFHELFGIALSSEDYIRLREKRAEQIKKVLGDV
jgi:hypothetical protein